MNHKPFLITAVLFVLVLAATTTSGQEKAVIPVRLVVKFAEPPVLKQWTSRLSAESARRLQGERLREAFTDKEVLAYRTNLQEIQNRRLERLQTRISGLKIEHRYLNAFNGISVSVSPAHVSLLTLEPGVVGVYPSLRLQPEDASSEEIIEAPAAWSRMAREYGIAQPGQGTRIAIIDNGIVPVHPSFSDAGYAAPPGFPISEMVRSGHRIPLPAGSANNKVIVGNIYASPEDINYTRAFFQPEAIHGSLVAAAAAGVPVRLPAAGSTLTIQGVAPYAYLINLAVPGHMPEYLAALDDAARYGADVLNISQGSTVFLGWAEGRNPFQEALEALAESGVVVCVSAGNAGLNGSSTISGTFKYSDQLLAVGNQLNADVTGRISAVSPAEAAASLNLQSLQLTSSYPFQATFRAPLVPTASITDTQGHIEDDYARRAIYPFPARSLEGKIALVENGSVGGRLSTYASKWANVKAGGAAAMLVYNNADLNTIDYAPMGRLVTADPYALMERDAGKALDQAARRYGTAFEVEISAASIILPVSNELAPKSSRGPTSHLRIKPDLVAPGQQLLLPAFKGDFVPDGFAANSGTSFSSPQVAGAAALLRQVHPEWSARQIRGALVTTVETQVATSRSSVNVMAQGAGSLRIDHALRAALHISPYTLSLGALESGQNRSVTIQIEDTRPTSDTTKRSYRILTVPAREGPVPVIAFQTATVALAGGQQGYFHLTFSTTGLSAGDYDGHLFFVSPDGSSQAIPYFVRVISTPLADVLLVLWRNDGSTTNYRSRYEAMLAQAGFRFETLELRRFDPMPTMQQLQRYKLIILATGDVTTSFVGTLEGGSFPWQNYLIAGGRLLITGHGFQSIIDDSDYIPANQGADSMLSGYAAGFQNMRNNPLPQSSSRLQIKLMGPLGAVDISSGMGGDGAGNGKYVDLGRPVSEADSAQVFNFMELAPHVQKLFTAAEVINDGSPISISSETNTVATGVWPNTTLEKPTAGVSWASAFLAFGLEAVNTSAGHLSGADLIQKLYRWLVDDLSVRLEVSDLVPGQAATLRAIVDSTLPNNSGVSFRWDFGDGSPIAVGQNPSTRHIFSGWPARAPRVEVTDSLGHTVVSPSYLYLPIITTAGDWIVQVVVHNTGTLPAMPRFSAFNDSGLELASRRDRSILPGGRLSINLAELFPSTAADLVRHVRIESSGNLEALAIVTSGDGEEMTSIPGRRWAQSQLYVPHISQATKQFYSKYAVVRTAAGSGTLLFEGNGSTRPLPALTAANSQDYRDFADLYGGTLPSGLEWGKFSHSDGSSVIAGVEIFGRIDGPRQLALLPLDGTVSRTLSFVHVSSDSDQFWTGIVYVNMGNTTAQATVKAFSANGTQRTAANHSLPAGGKQTLLFDRKVTTTVPSIPFSFPQDVAWVQVEASESLIGYEIFGTADESRLEGLAAATAGAKRLLFPYLQTETGQWTGVAIVNLLNASATARLKAMDAAGRILTTVTRSYAPFAKDLGLVNQLFGGTLPEGTTHIMLESDSLLWGFELFGDNAGRRMGGCNAFPLL